MAGKASVIVGALLAVAGILLIIGGTVIVPHESKNLFGSQLRDNIVVQSTSSTNYANWAGQQDIDNPYYMVFNFWNMVNPEAVRQGATPSFEKVGPFYYRRYRTSIDVSFPDDGNQIQYRNNRSYFYDMAMSGNRSDDIMITNINPSYLAILSQAGDEGQLYPAWSVAFIPTVINYLNGPFISLYVGYTFAPEFQTRMDAIITAIGGNSTVARQQFVNSWLNDLKTPSYPGDWTAMLVSEGLNAPANISFEVGDRLIDPNVPLSLMDSSPNAIQAWDQVLNNDTYMNAVMNACKLTADQVTLIWWWRRSAFAPTYLYPNWTSTYGLDTFKDIGWVQYFLMTPLGGQNIVPTFDLSAWGITADNSFEMLGGADVWGDWRAARQAWNPVNGVQNITAFAPILKSQNATAANLTAQQFQFLGLWAASYGLNSTGDITYPNSWFMNSYPNGYGGLVITKSVRDWIYNCNDPLVKVFLGDGSICNLLFNNTAFAPTTVWSGKDDLNKINTYVKWRNMSVIENRWAGPISPIGFTDLGQFAPATPYDGTPTVFPVNYTVFDTNFGKSLILTYQNDVTVSGIKARRYILNYQEVFKADPFYFQGALPGFTNVSSVQNGSPIFVSLWDMLYANTTQWGKLNQSATNETEDNTVLDIEPITGNAIQARQRLQANVYLAPGGWFSSSATGNNNFTTNMMFPLSQAGEYSTLSDKTADTLKSKLNLLPRVENALLIVGIVAGIILIILGAVLIWVGTKRMRSGYRMIN